jgi:hypothetical protein
LTEVYDKGCDQLGDFQKEKLKDFLIDFQDVFSNSLADIGYTDLVKHKINTGDSKPIKHRPYRIPLAKRESLLLLRHLIS